MNIIFHAGDNERLFSLDNRTASGPCNENGRLNKRCSTDDIKAMTCTDAFV